MKNRNWHGTDQSREESLFEYGLLIRWVPNQKSWQVIYRNPLAPNIFCFSWVEEKELLDIFNDGWAADKKKDFLDYYGITWEEYRNYDVLQKTQEFCDYFGVANLFGYDHSGGDTIKEICKRLKIKYDERYER